jgi:hypothetical protein
MNYRDYHAEVNELCRNLKYFQQQDIVRKAMLPASMAAHEADQVYNSAYQDYKLKSKDEITKDEAGKIDDLGVLAQKERNRFDELLGTVTLMLTYEPPPVAKFVQPMLAPASTAAAASVAAALVKPSISAAPPAIVIEDIQLSSTPRTDLSGSDDEFVITPKVVKSGVQPHIFALRDIIHANLAMPTIGKVSARGPLIAICELEEGYWIHNIKTQKIKLLRAGERILGICEQGIDTPQTAIKLICPYDKDNDCIGYIAEDVEDREHIVGKTGQYASYNKKGGFGPSYHATIIPNNYLSQPPVYESFTPGFLAYMAANNWHRDNGVDMWQMGMPNHINVIDDGRSQYRTDQTSSLNSYSFIKPYAPKFRIIGYEQSYRVVVAAPWDFDFARIKSRSDAGEQINLREEVERIILGTEAPIYIYGKGVEFEHVLESQIKRFNI